MSSKCFYVASNLPQTPKINTYTSFGAALTLPSGGNRLDGPLRVNTVLLVVATATCRLRVKTWLSFRVTSRPPPWPSGGAPSQVRQYTTYSQCRILPVVRNTVVAGISIDACTSRSTHIPPTGLPEALVDSAASGLSWLHPTADVTTNRHRNQCMAWGRVCSKPSTQRHNAPRCALKPPPLITGNSAESDVCNRSAALANMRFSSNGPHSKTSWATRWRLSWILASDR